MERRLAATLMADVVGYSRLMSADEAETLAALEIRRKTILDPLLARHHGRLVKSMGDGVLLEFASAVNAVECGVALQAATQAANEVLPEDQRIVLRVGINLGDVMVEGDDLFGDGINVAARLEALAEPGSVFISEIVFSQVRNRVPLEFDDLGLKTLKNIPESVRVYRVSRSAAASAYAETVQSKPSVLVLPFTNMSGDPEQEYFSDGITEDIITDLSQVSALFVVARHTAFTFKGKAVEVAEVGRRLNVRYLIEGSVRRAGKRVRITAQLVDGKTGGHVWAERYDREFGDVFALQDDITKSVVEALKVRLLPAELKTISDRSTSDSQAYEYYLRGRSKFHESWGSIATLRSARKLFAKAAEIDPGYAKAYTGIADCDAFLWINGDLGISFGELLAISTKALELAPNMAEAHASRGMALYVAGRAEEVPAPFERAIQLDPLLFGAHFFYAVNCKDRGEFDRAAALFERAAELRFDDFASLTLLANVYEAQGRYELSRETARRSLIRIESTLNQRPDAAEVLGVGAATLVYLGQQKRAVEWAKRSVSLEPGNFTIRYNAACTYAVTGDADAALEHLEYLYEHVPRARLWLLKIITTDPQMNPLRSRADFQEFMKRLEANART
jgi:adenylate cyclase